MKAYVGYLWPFLLKLTGNQPEMAIKPAFFTYFHHKCGLHTLCGAFGPPQMSVMYVGLRVQGHHAPCGAFGPPQVSMGGVCACKGPPATKNSPYGAALWPLSGQFLKERCLKCPIFHRFASFLQYFWQFSCIFARFPIKSGGHRTNSSAKNNLKKYFS